MIADCFILGNLTCLQITLNFSRKLIYIEIFAEFVWIWIKSFRQNKIWSGLKRTVKESFARQHHLQCYPAEDAKGCFRENDSNNVRQVAEPSLYISKSYITILLDRTSLSIRAGARPAVEGTESFQNITLIFFHLYHSLEMQIRWR